MYWETGYQQQQHTHTHTHSNSCTCVHTSKVGQLSSERWFEGWEHFVAKDSQSYPLPAFTHARFAPTPKFDLPPPPPPSKIMFPWIFFSPFIQILLSVLNVFACTLTDLILWTMGVSSTLKALGVSGVLPWGPATTPPLSTSCSGAYTSPISSVHVKPSTSGCKQAISKICEKCALSV